MGKLQVSARAKWCSIAKKNKPSDAFFSGDQLILLF